MGETPQTVGIAPGDGLVARFGQVVMYVADASPSAGALIDGIRVVSDTRSPGPAVARRLADVTFGPQAVEGPAFAVVAPTGDGLLVLLRGAVTAEVDTGQGTQQLSGARALTWVDQIVPGTAQRIAITGDAQSRLQCSPYTDLRAGVVPGGGFTVYLSGVPGRRWEQPASVSSEPTAGLTIPSGTPAQTRPSRSEPSRQHELRQAGETHSVGAVGGFLASADGAVYPLDRPYVIGRDPLDDDAVLNQLASPIVVHDDPHVSRVHARVSPSDAAVFVADASTPGGTFIAAPGAKSWTKIDTTPTELAVGWSLRIGQLILTYRIGGQP